MAGGGGKSSRCRLSYNFSDKKHLRFLVLCYNLSTLLKTRCETDEDGKFRGKEGNLYIEFRGNFCKLRDTLSFANRFFPSRENRVKLVFPLRAARCSSIDTSWTIAFRNFPIIIFDENYFKMIEQLMRFDLSLYKNRMIILRKHSIYVCDDK